MAIFKKYYLFFLILTIFVSYGQILGMYVWRDDNAVFFKFDHLSEKAGYLGVGLIGSQPYKLTVTPYWFVYKLFGTENLVPYYALALIFYIIAAVAVYKVFSQIVTPSVGRIAGLLFACGYIASDGFMWLTTSITQSLSIILVLLTLNHYALYGKIHKYRFYLTAWALYFLASYFNPARTHYFILVIISYELLFLFSPKKILKSIWRILPFILVFFEYIFLGDRRTGGPIQIFKDIILGKIYYLYSFLTTLGHLFIPDVQVRFIPPRTIVELLIVFGAGLVFYYVFKELRHIKIKVLLFIVVGLSLIPFSSILIHSTPTLYQGSSHVVFMGSLILLSSLFTIYLVKKDTKRTLLFFLIWLCANTYAFSSLEPYSAYPSTARYVAHSFIPLVGLLAVVFVALVNQTRIKFFATLILLWGATNIYNSVTYQHSILKTKSQPARKFYQDLKKQLPQISKGDTIYIDVADDAREAFNAAFTVSQMPEETALAWRYGLDRYDLSLETEFDKLAPISLSQLHTFFYSRNQLTDTTEFTRQYFTKSVLGKNVTLPLDAPLNSQVPIDLEVQLIAKASTPGALSFPLVSNIALSQNSVAKDANLRSLATDYAREVRLIMASSEVVVSSHWQDDVAKNLSDNNIDTAWRPDRVEWADTKGRVTIDLKKTLDISKFAWLNAYPNSTPSLYFIEVSPDNERWTQVIDRSNSARLENTLSQVVEFDPVQARFVRMNLRSSLNEDAPGIAEVWVIPTKFKSLPIVAAEEFLKQPFGFVPDEASFLSTLRLMDYRGTVSFWWKNNKTNKWETSPLARQQIAYDGLLHTYLFKIPAGGTNISELKLESEQIPGNIQIKKITAKHICTICF